MLRGSKEALMERPEGIRLEAAGHYTQEDARNQIIEAISTPFGPAT